MNQVPPNSGRPPARQQVPSERELIMFSAILMSTVALSIDIMLPSLGDIAADFDVLDDNRRQWVITSLIMGLTVGQLIFGPLADRIGRRPVVFTGTTLVVAGSALAALATNFETLLLGRILQGLGAAGPRIAVVAMIRDRFEGQAMARIMSFVMGVFIVIPVLAPVIGQWLLNFMNWRGLFIVVGLFIFCGALWLFVRQPETLRLQENTSLPQMRKDAVTILTSMTPMIYTLAAACCFGAFLGFITSAQQLFQDLYQVGNRFAILFGFSSMFVALAMFVNARLVRSFSLETICIVAMTVQVSISCAFVLLIIFSADTPHFRVWMAFNCPVLFLLGLTFGNYNAIALRTLGHIAGFASAIYATITSAISVTLAALVGMSFNMTPLPLFTGYLVFGGIGLLLMLFDSRGRLQRNGAGSLLNPL